MRKECPCPLCGVLITTPPGSFGLGRHSFRVHLAQHRDERSRRALSRLADEMARHALPCDRALRTTDMERRFRLWWVGVAKHGR